MSWKFLDPADWNLDPGPREPLIYGFTVGFAVVLIIGAWVIMSEPVNLADLFWGTVISLNGFIFGAIVYDILKYHREEREWERRLDRIEQSFKQVIREEGKQ